MAKPPPPALPAGLGYSGARPSPPALPLGEGTRGPAASAIQNAGDVGPAGPVAGGYDPWHDPETDAGAGDGPTSPPPGRGSQ
eukprot:6029909-Lingulodinium_polyedra.AAC.1